MFANHTMSLKWSNKITQRIYLINDRNAATKGIKSEGIAFSLSKSGTFNGERERKGLVEK